MNKNLKAVFFGSIGTIAETSEIQRRSYNLAFKRLNIDCYWNVANYCEMLKVPGGKDRIRNFTIPNIAEDLVDNIHSAIHKARNKDLHCVMHTHEPMSQTIAALKEKVIPMFQEACQLYERVGYHDFEGIVLDASEKKRLIKSLGKSNHTLVLRNHGLITAGPSAIWAFIRHQVFIRNAEIQLRAMSSGGKIIKIPKKVMVHTRKQFEGGAAQGGAEVRHPEWPAYWRLLDKLDPSWKK